MICILAWWFVLAVIVALLLAGAIGRADLTDEWSEEDA